MAKFRCGGCKNYFDQEEDTITNGVQRFCSRECVYGSHQTAFSKKGKKKSSDVPDSVRKAVLERDRNRCKFCRSSEGLHLHHVYYRSQGGEHVEHNLITLCHRHHSTVHSDKKRFQPLCLGVLWLSIVDKKHTTIPQLERFLNAEASRNQVRQQASEGFPNPTGEQGN